jgi:ABC-type branched-subunit amino acid transport system permease subunit
VGALLGTLVIRLLNIQASGLLPNSWPLVVGMFFILVVLFVPGGIVGGLSRLARSAGGWRRPSTRRRELIDE